MNHPSSPWTEERIAYLKRLWMEGRSAADIGALLGCTRCSVLGKIHRLGMSMRGNVAVTRRVGGRPAGAQKKHRKLAVVSARQAVQKWVSSTRKLHVEALPPAAETDIGRKTFQDLEPGECKFIVGEPVGKCFCAAPVIAPQSPYCMTHHLRCFTPAFDGRSRRPAELDVKPQTETVV